VKKKNKQMQPPHNFSFQPDLLIAIRPWAIWKIPALTIILKNWREKVQISNMTKDFFFFVKRKQNKQKNGSVYFFAWSVFLIIIHFWLAGVFKYLLNGSAMCFFHGSGFGIFISGFLWIEWPPPLSSHSIILLIPWNWLCVWSRWYFIYCAISSFLLKKKQIVQSSILPPTKFWRHCKAALLWSPNCVLIKGEDRTNPVSPPPSRKIRMR
jgi:hypothetical protein